MDYYLGEIRIFAGNFAPRGWHFCDGSRINISDNQALFALLGTTYGGDGINNFQLPNLQARVGIGAGKISTTGTTYTLAQAGGSQEVVLTNATMPVHNHALNALTVNASTADPTGAKVLAASVPDGAGYTNVKLYASLPSGSTTPDSQLDPRAVWNVGSGLAHENMMPFTTINYIISMNGIFPSQD